MKSSTRLKLLEAAIIICWLISTIEAVAGMDEAYDRTLTLICAIQGTFIIEVLEQKK